MLKCKEQLEHGIGHLILNSWVESCCVACLETRGYSGAISGQVKHVILNNLTSASEELLYPVSKQDAEDKI